MQRTRGHVESAWVDENLTTCPRAGRLETSITDGSKVRKNLSVPQSRSARGISRHNISPGRREQTLSNQT